MNPIALIAGLAAVVLFGASPVAAKVAVSTIAALDVAILRTVIGGLLALPITLGLRIGLPETNTQRRLLLLSGFCGFVAFPLIFTFGVVRTSANHASMILAVLPVFTGGIAMLWDRQKPKSLWWVGCVIAIVGEVFLISSRGNGAGQASIEGDLLVFVSNIFASLGYVAGGRLQKSGYSAKGVTFWGVALFAIAMLPFCPFMLDFDQLAVAGYQAWNAVIFLAFVVTILAYILWYWALGTGGIARIGLLQFLQPVSGVILAFILLSEQINLQFLLASAVIMTGVFLAFRAK